jgi:hypothetical protein
MFASFSDTMDQGFMMAIFCFATLFVMARQFAAKNPETAKKAGGAAVKTGFSIARRFLK